jgi:hypothetical protein
MMELAWLHEAGGVYSANAPSEWIEQVPNHPVEKSSDETPLEQSSRY